MQDQTLWGCRQHIFAVSNPEPIKYGVPQGSVLGPLLFIIFINNLPLENLSSEIDMYADDTTLSIKGKNILEIEATLNDDINSVNMWCTNNNMVINPTKTTCMLIGTVQPRRILISPRIPVYEIKASPVYSRQPPPSIRQSDYTV